MKRRIELWIDGSPADLDTNGLILMNYALTDLEKPSAVKNSFSKQITLPGTPANTAIFGHIARADRRISLGFNPGKKTPFEAFNELGERVLSGYIRLDSVTRKSGIITGYKCSLFGGLGSFFYNLSYDDEGNKKTLADLDYLGTGSPTELDFDITATSVITAWARLYNYPDALEQKWDVINFAPAYNGCPDGDFSADKGIVNAANVGLQTSVVDGDNTYITNSGNTLVNLPNGVDEWAAKDLRSYLQRPVLSMKAFLAAIANPANNGGYEVDLSNLPTYYKNIWKTLPMLPSLGGLNQSEGYALATFSAMNAYHSNSAHQVADVAKSSGQTIPVGAECSFQGDFYVDFTCGYTGDTIYMHASQVHPDSNRNFYHKDAAIFAQLVAYGSGGVVVGGSQVRLFTNNGHHTPQELAETVGFVPKFAEAGYESARVEVNELSRVNGKYRLPESTFRVEANSIAYVRLELTAYFLESFTWVVRGSGGRETHHYQLNSFSGGTSACPVLFASYSSTYQVSLATGGRTSTATPTISYTTPSDLRSGARITKKFLLSSQYTPAEYLISFCKQFGLLFVCDSAEKKITIHTRNSFYGTEESVIDLTERVDLGQDITIQPLAMKSKWYNLKNAVAEGSFAKEYKDVYGVDYAVQRVNTGYDFDASEVNLMDGFVYRGAASILGHNKYWVKILVNSQFRPSPFLDRDVTYTLWNQSSGEAKTFPVPGIPTSATLVMYNINRDYYDMEEVVLRLDLADADNKPVDGTDILVYYKGSYLYDSFKVSDDSAAMMALNDGKPCWDLNKGSGSVRVPTFTRHYQVVSGVEYAIVRGLDFGIPREVDIPDCEFTYLGCCYNRYWRNYLADLLDKDTKVMKCRVDLSRLDVCQELFRRFFYYDGSLWVLNKINNYSLTTWDPAECEFVQVQDVENYTNGQTFERID